MVYLLIMSANQKTVAAIFSSSALLNVLGNLLLIPLYGIEGAALATGISIVAWNLLMVHQVRKRLGIKATLFGVPAGLKNMPEDR